MSEERARGAHSIPSGPEQIAMSERISRKMATGAYAEINSMYEVSNEKEAEVIAQFFSENPEFKDQLLHGKPVEDVSMRSLIHRLTLLPQEAGETLFEKLNTITREAYPTIQLRTGFSREALGERRDDFLQNRQDQFQYSDSERSVDYRTIQKDHIHNMETILRDAKASGGAANYEGPAKSALITHSAIKAFSSFAKLASIAIDLRYERLATQNGQPLKEGDIDREDSRKTSWGTLSISRSGRATSLKATHSESAFDLSVTESHFVSKVEVSKNGKILATAAVVSSAHEVGSITLKLDAKKGSPEATEESEKKAAILAEARDCLLENMANEVAAITKEYDQKLEESGPAAPTAP